MEIDTKEVKRLPADLFSDDIPKTEVNPFADKVKEKGYTNVQAQSPPSTNGSAQQTPPPPVEPAFKESKEKESEPSTAEKAFNNQEFKSTPPPPQPAGDASISSAPATPVKTPEEVKTNAEQTVKMFWDGYEQIHAGGRWIGKVNINKLRGLHANRKINLKHEFPAEEGTITAIEVFEEQNRHIDESIQVSPKLKIDLTPPLERLAVKYNVLSSDEWYVGIALGKDLVVKGGMLFGVYQTYKDILKFLIYEMEEKNKAKESEKKSNRESTIKESTTKSTNKSGTSETKESGGNIPVEEEWNAEDEPTEPEEKANQGNTGEQQTTT